MFLYVSTYLSFQFHSLDNPLLHRLNFGFGVGVRVRERVNLRMGQGIVNKHPNLESSIPLKHIGCFDFAIMLIGPHRYAGFVQPIL